MRITGIILVGFLFMSFIAPPASAQFFLCEKTNQNGDPISPDSPQYRLVDYDSEILPLLRNLVNVGLIGVFAVGIVGGVYATIRDGMYTAEGDQNAARYVRMRIRLILLGFGFPLFVFVSGFILEYLTTYETTCFLPSIL